MSNGAEAMALPRRTVDKIMKPLVGIALATLAFVGTVLSETVAANKGIGNVMMIASSNFDVALVFAGLIILAVLGVFALSA